jgi:hypothetical protein
MPRHHIDTATAYQTGLPASTLFSVAARLAANKRPAKALKTSAALRAVRNADVPESTINASGP